MYKIFLADDEVWITMGLKKLIERSELPYSVIGEAANGVTSLEEVRSKRPDVLITDIRMPGLSGLELLEKINKENLGTKVVLISGYAEFEYAREGLRLGAFDYLLKPIEQEKLQEVLQALLQELQAERGEPEGTEKEEGINSTMIRQIVNEIQETYLTDVTLGSLGEKYGLSASRLSSLLKEELGLPFSEYLAAKRMQKAKELLKNETLSVEAIAELVGYHDYFYFTKVFKKVTGITPSKYRKSL